MLGKEFVYSVIYTSPTHNQSTIGVICNKEFSRKLHDIDDMMKSNLKLTKAIVCGNRRQRHCHCVIGKYHDDFTHLIALPH
ncbi:Hypothetical predicted protein [Octopus vulgaris]|uniref:Uncharacterized protein n=1 Tax=Octopus vulgaris TaxID=6645 RepID=A0AA36AIS8_OCTVU|nr:Hypothetical predicted protein [Octopus vulgaris]